LPGIGEVTADKIIANRPYDSIENFYSVIRLNSSVKAKLTNILVTE
jgi:DNA uptake protein ComE-like DNA-binding protein